MMRLTKEQQTAERAFQLTRTGRTRALVLADLADWLPDLTPERHAELLDEAERRAVEAAKVDEQGRPTCIAYVQPTSRYVALTEDGTAWTLDSGMDQGAARRVLIANGFTPSDAKRILDDHAVIHAVAVDTIPNASRVAVRDGCTVLNAWVPPGIAPTPGSFPVLDEVISFVSGTPEAKAWLMSWLAAALRRPAERFRTSPILSGQQRTGKSVLIRAVRALIGEGNSKNIRSEDVTSRFSASFATSLLVSVSEIDTSDLDAAQGCLRYLTGEDRIMVEGKFAAAREVKNRLKLIGSTNKRDPVRVDTKDTRWTILRQDAAASPEYLARIETLFSGSEWSALGRAEVAALGHHLLSMPLDESVTNMPLRNAARDEAIAMSRSSVEAFADAVDEMSLDGVWVRYVPAHEHYDRGVYRFLDVPGRPDATTREAVYSTYKEHAKASGRQPVGADRFVSELKDARPRWEYLGRSGGHDRRVVGPDGVKMTCWRGLPRNPSLRGPRPEATAAVARTEPRSNDLGPAPDVGEQARAQQLASVVATLGGRVGRA